MTSATEVTTPAPQPGPTYMQQVYQGACTALESEMAKNELRGISRDQVKEAVRLMTDGLGQMPGNASLHAVLFAVTYMRNVLIATMQANADMLAHTTGGTA